jgi:hypothetical protein
MKVIIIAVLIIGLGTSLFADSLIPKTIEGIWVCYDDNGRDIGDTVLINITHMLVGHWLYMDGRPYNKVFRDWEYFIKKNTDTVYARFNGSSDSSISDAICADDPMIKIEFRPRWVLKNNILKCVIPGFSGYIKKVAGNK